VGTGQFEKYLAREKRCLTREREPNSSLGKIRSLQTIRQQKTASSLVLERMIRVEDDRILAGMAPDTPEWLAYLGIK
jgi:hypothetical protein